jgi:Glucose / Sorbosone dehydrogenase
VQQLQALPLALTRMGDTQMLTAIAWRAGDPNPYLADQHGIIYHLVNGRSDPVLDLTAEVMDYQPGAEYGMLGMTFDPVDGRIILGFNGNDGDTRIASYAVGDNGRPDPASAREIPRIHKPGVGHNNGQLAFDADSNLFISMGDGVGSRGADAQDTTKLLGGLLRITPNRDGPGYTVPADNPTSASRASRPRSGPRACAIRGDFHRPRDRRHVDRRRRRVELGGRLQDLRRAKGYNLGWPAYEGSHEAHFNDDVPPPPNRVMPVCEYPHTVGPAVIGGHVYRGNAIRSSGAPTCSWT